MGNEKERLHRGYGAVVPFCFEYIENKNEKYVNKC